jgi:uncharacterized phage-associated protein
MENLNINNPSHKTTYTPAHIANFFISKSQQEALNLDPMKLLKLVYIAYGWNLAINDSKLFNEPILAWNYGPVIASLYHEIRAFPFNDKNTLDKDFRCAIYQEDSATFRVTSIPQIDEEDLNVMKVLDAVWINYKKCDGISLSRITHEDGSPWHQAYFNNGKNSQLDDELIKKRSTQAIEKFIEREKNKKA